MASVIYGAVLAPWFIRNYEVLGAVVFTTGSAETLYIGNNDHSPRGRGEWQNDADPAFVAYANSLPELKRSTTFASAAREWIAAHPLQFLKVGCLRMIRFWNIVPNTNEVPWYYAWVTAPSFGPVLILAIVCSATWRPWRDLWPIWLLIAWFSVLHFIVLGSLRYRLPLEPFLIVMASWPIARLAFEIWPPARRRQA
jgi:hypothetical protein